MIVMFITTTACETCGYGNRGVMAGKGYPGMRQLRVEDLWGLTVPSHCQECGRPMGADRPGTVSLDLETRQRLVAWRERQRARRKARVA